MPELPEVENVARGLKPWVGKKLKSLQLVDERVWFESEVPPSDFENKVLTEATRRGKYLILRFGPSLSIVQHLRMTGKMLEENSGLIPEPIRSDPEGPKRFQIRARFLFEGKPLVFFDPRRFGTLTAVKDEEAFFGGKGIAPDPITTEPVARALFLSKMKGRSQPVKPSLLDQRLAAGVGNIYADEALHRVGIHPALPAGKVKEPTRIWEALQEILHRSIALGGSSIIDYVNAAGERGTFSSQLLVYGRDGEPCLGCGTTIKKITLGGRSTHFCPNCQPKRGRPKPTSL